MGVYVYRNDRVEGPFDELVLQQALANKTMGSEELCCREGEEDWLKAAEMFRSATTVLPIPPSASVPSSPSRIETVIFGKAPPPYKLIACILGGFCALLLLGGVIGSFSDAPAKLSPRQTIETRLVELKRQDEEIELQSQATSSKAAGLMFAVAQMDENKRQGFYTPPQEVEKITQQYMTFLMETARIDKAHKEIAAERDDLTKRLKSM